MRRSSLGSSATGVAEEAAEVIALPTALTRETNSAPVAQRRAVAYVRESTEEQGKGFSPEGQRQAIAAYACEHGFALIDEYMDLESGRGVEKRDDFQRLIGDAGAHKFDAVLIFHTSRGSRETRSRPSTTRSSSAQSWASKLSQSRSHSATPTTPPRSSPSPSTRSSTSTTPSRSRSGPRWASRRKPAKAS